MFPQLDLTSLSRREICAMEDALKDILHDHRGNAAIREYLCLILRNYDDVPTNIGDIVNGAITEAVIHVIDTSGLAITPAQREALITLAIVQFGRGGVEALIGIIGVVSEKLNVMNLTLDVYNNPMADSYQPYTPIQRIKLIEDFMIEFDAQAVFEGHTTYDSEMFRPERCEIVDDFFEDDNNLNQITKQLLNIPNIDRYRFLMAKDFLKQVCEELKERSDYVL